ncbi:MAG: lipopolysaccharide biosynthesis protein [Pseudonocardia sp.]
MSARRGSIDDGRSGPPTVRLDRVAPGLDAPTVPIRVEREAVKGEAGKGEAGDGWRAPQHRDGMALVLSSAVASGIGMLFWVLAARMFDPGIVGVSTAAISAVTMLASASHLNLGNALLRFVPVARHRGAVIAGCFAVGIGVGTVVGLVFAIGATLWAPDLVEAFGHPGLIALFVVGVPIWTVFVLQDSALTSIRRAKLVLVENVVFAVLKIALLVVAAWWGLTSGIVLGTIAATALVVLMVTVWLVRALRTPPAASSTAISTVTARDLAGFVGVDYAGNVAWQAAVFGIPLIVIALTDPDGAAVYGMAWQITYALYLVVTGMGKSMVAHAATGDSATIERARRGMDRKAMTLILPAAIVVALGAPLILSVFGRTYAETGTLVLALLALSAIPNVVTNSAVWEARVRRHRAVQFGLPTAISATVITATLVLVPSMGITGVGWAWLCAQTVAAVGVLLVRWRTRRAGAQPA